jgi:hypothetical protein
MWRGPATFGSAAFVPGSAIQVLSDSATQYIALVVDRNGVLNNFVFDAVAGWSGPDTSTGSNFVPGSLVSAN